MLKYDPIYLASCDKKSIIYFRNLDEIEKENVLDLFRLLCYIDNIYDCKCCRYNFTEFTRT